MAVLLLARDRDDDIGNQQGRKERPRDGSLVRVVSGSDEAEGGGIDRQHEDEGRNADFDSLRQEAHHNIL